MNHPTSDPAGTPDSASARPEAAADPAPDPGPAPDPAADPAADPAPDPAPDDPGPVAEDPGPAPDDPDPAADPGPSSGDATAAATDAAPSDDGADSPSAEASDTEVEDEGDSLDIEALADSDPRSKAELLAELMAAEGKRDEYLDDLRRSHADFENYRRRVLREGATQRAAGKAEVAGALLEVLDDLDRTLVAAEGSPDPDLHTGIRLVASKLVDALRQLGLERIDAAEVVFDPEVHEAVQQQPGDGLDGEPKVVTVLRPGYRLDDRVLRAAMVAVQG